MVKFEVEVEIPMDAEAYLAEKDSEAFKAFHMKKMGTVEQENLSRTVEDGYVTTVTRTVPTINIPYMLRKAILGNKQVEFVDKRRWLEGTHLTAPFTQSFHTTNNITSACTVEGTITVEHAGVPGRCRIRVLGECVVTLKGFGAKVENLIVNNLKAGYAKQPEVMAEWMAVRPASAASVADHLDAIVADHVIDPGDRAPPPMPFEAGLAGNVGGDAREGGVRLRGRGAAAAAAAAESHAYVDVEGGGGWGGGDDGGDDPDSKGSKLNRGRGGGGGYARAHGGGRAAVARHTVTVLLATFAAFVVVAAAALFWATAARSGTDISRGASGVDELAPVVIATRVTAAAAAVATNGARASQRDDDGGDPDPEAEAAAAARGAAARAEARARMEKIEAGGSNVLERRAGGGGDGGVSSISVGGATARKGASASALAGGGVQTPSVGRSVGGARGVHPEVMMRGGRGGGGEGNDASEDMTTDVAAINAGVAPPPGVSCVDEKREACETWACAGECVANPGFMRQSCPCACDSMAAQKSGVRGAITAGAADASRGIALGLSWTSPGGEHRTARVRIRLDPADAPKAVAAVRASVKEGTCAPGAVCGGGCHFHRAEVGYGLVQGNLAGIGAAGGSFGARTEGKASWRRGTAGYIPGGDNLLIATKAHPEWDASFTAIGTVLPEDMGAVDELLGLATEPFVHPTYKTTMAMLKNKVRYTLEGALDV